MATKILEVTDVNVIRAAGGIVCRSNGNGKTQIVVVHRPAYDDWTLPKGKIEPEETPEDCALREVREETGLRVTAGSLVGMVTRPGGNGTTFEIRDYAVVVTGGTLAAGDDAADVRWASPAELDRMEARAELSPGLLAALRSWGAIGPP